MKSQPSLSKSVTFVEEIVIESKLIQKGHWEKSHYVSSRLTGSWTKWGGARKSLYENQFERENDNWFCQKCGTEHPKEITPYNYEFIQGEFIRICAVCFSKV